MALKFLHNQTEVNLTEFPDGLLAIFTTKNDSSFFQTQLGYLEEKRDSLKSLNMTVLFAVDENSEVSSPDVVNDENREILNLSSRVADQSELGENLILFQKKGSELIYADTKESPEEEYNWIETVEQVAKNFLEKDPDESNYFMWGQVVPETAEYLCKDCGYIQEFQAGEIFPICEVCIAGEPAGPSGPGEGFWEKV